MDHHEDVTVYEVDEQPVRDRLGIDIQFLVNRLGVKPRGLSVDSHSTRARRKA